MDRSKYMKLFCLKAWGILVLTSASFFVISLFSFIDISGKQS
jgi:hypothetical protein